MSHLCPPDTPPCPAHRIALVRRPPQRARIHCWQVPPIQDYGEAREMGREYAAHLLRLLHDCPQHAGNGLLGLIASDIDYADASAAKGFCGVLRLPGTGDAARQRSCRWLRAGGHAQRTPPGRQTAATSRPAPPFHSK